MGRRMREKDFVIFKWKLKHQPPSQLVHQHKDEESQSHLHVRLGGPGCTRYQAINPSELWPCNESTGFVN